MNFPQISTFNPVTNVLRTFTSESEFVQRPRHAYETPLIRAVQQYCAFRRPGTLTMSPKKYERFVSDWYAYHVRWLLVPTYDPLLDAAGVDHELCRGWIVRPLEAA